MQGEKRILLVNPPNIEEPKLDAETIPLGLLYLQAFLMQQGFQTEVINLYFEKSWSSVLGTLNNHKFDLIGIPVYTQQRKSAYGLMQLAKISNPDAIVVAGGPHVSCLDVETLRHYPDIDYVVRGEGELTFSQLLEGLDNKNMLENKEIRGLTFRSSSGTIIRNEPQELIPNLDALPDPDHTRETLQDSVNCNALQMHFAKEGHGNLVAPILTSRGCPWSNCVWCFNGVYWGKIQRYRSPERIFKEMKRLNEKFNVRFFDTYDDAFTGNKTRVLSLCNLLSSGDMQARFWCSSRVSDVDFSILSALKKAGCFKISYGVESGSQEILRKIHKGITIKEIIKTARMTHDLDIDLRITLCVGNPGENQKSISDTVNLIKQIQPDSIGLFIAQLFPGTPLYHIAVEKKSISDEYWFSEDSEPFPMYTCEQSSSRLIEQIHEVLYELRDNIINCIQSSNYCTELSLQWN